MKVTGSSQQADLLTSEQTWLEIKRFSTYMSKSRPLVLLQGTYSAPLLRLKNKTSNSPHY